MALTQESIREIPAEHKTAFTMEGVVPVLDRYFNQKPKQDKITEYRWPQILKYALRVLGRRTQYYGLTDTFMYRALSKHKVRGLDLVVMGSVRPWYETMAWVYGAKVTTIEYNKIDSKVGWLSTYQVGSTEVNNLQFDAAFSISSFEHDGLGRYGDPINPDGDLLAMQHTKSIIRKNGLLFLAVPVGKDAVVWNAHRIYGCKRLPKLLQNWELIDSFGFGEELFEKPLGEEIQPVFVLRNS
jgi:hypothetical protein